MIWYATSKSIYLSELIIKIINSFFMIFTEYNGVCENLLRELWTSNSILLMSYYTLENVCMQLCL